MAVAVGPGGSANQHSPGNNKIAASQQNWQNTDNMEQNVYEMGGDVNGSDGGGNWADDTIERSGNLFGQLDSMIAAVQNESTALDSMREKLRELDGMRVQLSSLTKRLLEADQANLTLKSNLVKIQEAYADLRRQKQEVSVMATRHTCMGVYVCISARICTYSNSNSPSPAPARAVGKRYGAAASGVKSYQRHLL
jgi:hypothetical protein